MDNKQIEHHQPPRPVPWAALGLATLLGVGLSSQACIMTSLPPDESMRRSKCGACHLPPPRGAHSRAVLREALDEHRRRVPLTGEQRRRLLDYLAASPRR